jgi:hypothetical protein
MAKAKPGAGQNSEGRGTKSAAIRELLTQNPKMPVKDVVTALAGRGMKVNSNLVSTSQGSDEDPPAAAAAPAGGPGRPAIRG